MLDILNQGWFGSLIGLAGVLIGVLGLMLYWNSKIGARPTCQMKSVRLIGKEEQELPPEVDIFFEGRPVPRLTLTRLYFWNSGKATIRGSQVVEDDPLRFEFQPGDEILKAHVAVVTRKVNKLDVAVVADPKHSVKVKFDFLDPQDGARIELLHSSKRRYPKVYGTIRGIPRGVTEVARPRQNAFYKVFTQLFPRRELIFKIFLVFGFLTLLLGLLPSEWLLKVKEVIEPKPDTAASPTLIPLRITFFTVGVLYTLLPFSLLLSRRKRYPDILDSEVDRRNNAEQ